jgi:hypothetical protein
MLVIDNIPILENEMTIVETLQHDLHSRGIQKLAVIKKTHHNIQVCCPIHKDGRERKPSCGINLDPNNGTAVGTVHCFTCGYVASFTQFISDCFGYNDEGTYGKRWLLENFVSLESNNRQQFSLNLSRKKVKQEFVSEQELDSYRYIHPYMYKRKLTDEIIEKFDVGYDKNTQCVTFPVWDERGRCVFVARRSVNTKFFNYPKEVSKPIYALNFIPDYITQVVVCESIINALTCWTWGIPAIALIGTGSYEQYPILQGSHIRKFLLALDPDEAGHKGRVRFRKNIKGKMIVDLPIPEGKDVNDMTEEEFVPILTSLC